jgi:hypothetical protein
MRHCSMTGVQARDGRKQRVGQQRAIEPGEALLRGVRAGVPRRVRGLEAFDSCSVTTPVPVLGADHVCGNSEQPGQERILHQERPVTSTPRLEKHDGQQILRVLRTRAASAPAIDRLRAGTEQVSERSGVPLPDLGDRVFAHEDLSTSHPLR